MNSSHAPAAAAMPLARIIPRSEHTVSRAHISPNALRVLYRLREGGFQAYFVGGCVRDLLLGLEPKDFDVATDALPEQVRKLFRNCRLVGRRFRLAHVFFGRETIEVATFRAAAAPPPGDETLSEEAIDSGADDDGYDETADNVDPDDTAELPSPDVSASASNSPARAYDSARELRDTRDDPLDRAVDSSGRILRDNVYGSIDDDVWRRDFTANSLYYNIADFSIWDYVGGVQDIQARVLKLIGDPETRFREDPVRMLRAARFEAKLGFSIDPATAEQIGKLRGLLTGVPSARLFDETLKLFLSGHGLKSFEVLRARGLLGELFPSLEHFLSRHPDSTVERLLRKGLQSTDDRVRADKPVTPTFLFALLLYGPIAGIIESRPPETWHELSTILDACDEAVRSVQVRVALPRRFALGIREMFGLQPRLESPRGKRALRSLEHPRFRAAFDLLVLRAELGLASPEVVQWWNALQDASPEERTQLAESTASDANPRAGARRGPRRRRRRSRPPAS